MENAFAIHKGLVVTPAGVISGHSVIVRDGKIVGVVPFDRATIDSPKNINAHGALIAPGLIDLHTHGALGRSFAEQDQEAYDTILHFLAVNGITTAHASLPTADFDALEGQLAWVRKYRRATQGATLHGVHLEGPYLSEEDQARGAANPAYLRRPQAGDAARLLKYADVLSMLTIAPELPGAIELIETLASHGVTIAIGHSSAERDDFSRATRAGASHITHLWSGMTNILRRADGERIPGLIECALASGLTAEVIADGKHLPPELLEIARRCLGGPARRLCAVSDASIGTGMPDGYRYGPSSRIVEVRDGVARLLGQSRFAGSTTPLNSMGKFLISLGWPITEVVDMLSSVPATVLSLSHLKGAIRPGYDADLALFDDRFNCVGTMIGGVWIEPSLPPNAHTHEHSAPANTPVNKR